MSYAQNSFFCSLCLSLWHWLKGAYEASVLGHLIDSFCVWLSRKWEASFLVHLFYDEGRLSLAWGDSATCRALEWVLNIPLRFLRWLYRLLKRPLEGSFFASVAFEAGCESSIAAGWFIALIMAIPNEYWSNVYSLIAACLVLMLVYLSGMNTRKGSLSLRSIGPYAVCFATVTILSVPLADFTGLSSRYLVYYIPCMIIVVALVNGTSSGRQLLRVGGGLALGTLIGGGYGIFQNVVIGVGVNASFTDMSVNSDMPGRVYSFYENPNALALLLLLTLPVIVALIFSSQHWFSRIVAAGVFVVGGVCLGMTYGRASWVGLAVAALVYVFLWNRKLLPFCVLAGIAALPLLPSSIINRILSIANLNDTSTSSRFDLWAAGLKVIQQEPITGVGLGADAVRRMVKLTQMYQGRASFVHCHNIYLQIWAEMGLLGLISFLGTMLGMMKSAARAVRHCPNSPARHIAIGGTSALLGAMVCGLADYLWTYPRIMFLFWFVFGLTLAAIKVCKIEMNRV